MSKRRIRFVGGPLDGCFKAMDRPIPSRFTVPSDGVNQFQAWDIQEGDQLERPRFRTLDYLLMKRSESLVCFCGDCPAPMFEPQWESVYVTREQMETENEIVHERVQRARQG